METVIPFWLLFPMTIVIMFVIEYAIENVIKRLVSNKVSDDRDDFYDDEYPSINKPYWVPISSFSRRTGPAKRVRRAF